MTRPLTDRELLDEVHRRWPEAVIYQWAFEGREQRVCERCGAPARIPSLRGPVPRTCARCGHRRRTGAAPVLDPTATRAESTEE